MNETPIVIREIQNQDVDNLVAALAPDVSPAHVALQYEEYVAGSREILVAEYDGQTVGTVSTGGQKEQVPDTLWMFALDVGHQYRRRGIGTALIMAVEDEAAERGLEAVRLEVALDNMDAIRLYKRLGYDRTGSPITVRWSRLDRRGKPEQVLEQVWVLNKRVGR